MFRVNPQRSAADLIAVQINHPIVDLALVSTTEWKQTGVLGLLGRSRSRPATCSC
jgi:hypothetical protein